MSTHTLVQVRTTRTHTLGLPLSLLVLLPHKPLAKIKHTNLTVLAQLIDALLGRQHARNGLNLLPPLLHARGLGLRMHDEKVTIIAAQRYLQPRVVADHVPVCCFAAACTRPKVRHGVAFGEDATLREDGVLIEYSADGLCWLVLLDIVCFGQKGVELSATGFGMVSFTLSTY